MSLLDRIFAYTGGGGVSDLENPALWLTNWAGSTKATSGETVNSDTAMGLAAYYACLRVISEDIAKLPLKTYKRLDGGGKEVDPKNPVYKLIHDEPNQYMTAFTLRELLTHWALGWGNGYAEILGNRGGDAGELIPIHPVNVTVKLNGQTLTYKIRNVDGTERYVQPQNMLHVHGLGPDGLVGYSVLTVACESLGLSLAAQKFGGAFFGNGTTLTGVLETPVAMSDDAKNSLRSQWGSLYTGAQNAAHVAILEEGMKFSKIGIPPEEAQFLESRQFQTEEICRWFRVPPHKIQHLQRSTFSNIEQQALEYVTDTLMPWAVRWEQEINRKLLGIEGDIFCEHVFSGLLRGDQASRGQFYRTMLEVGGLSPDEIRELENMNPVPGGDQRFRPANLTPLDMESSPPSEEPGSAMPPMPEEPQEPPEPESPEEEPEEEQVDARAALYPVFLDAARRAVRKETAAGLRALESHKGNRQKFEAWSAKFFDEDHLQFLSDTFQPAIEAMILLGNVTGEGIFPLSAHVQAVMASLDDAFHSDGNLFEANEEARAEALARAVQETLR